MNLRLWPGTFLVHPNMQLGIRFVNKEFTKTLNDKEPGHNSSPGSFLL